ncbi:MAG TPA: hypothetical protein IGS52_13330 [Oscillatoriaceae cyanobacterium M33_DOE_052]|uniref:Chemotaxis protein n=1 Tax=Planktothricoides sp. SpSt-374 TaxID=2282167 RepID=A0A7C3VSZ5_9CYAN|nr:hypothetical protein [Oscillatoriaceae cyanobacterium M33_DOE_052]
MPARSHQFTITALGAAALVIGCTNAKVSQCHKLIQGINHGVQAIADVELNRSTTALQIGTALDTTTKKLEKLPLKDEKLQAFRRRFVIVFTALSQAFSEIGEAMSLVEIAQPNQAGITTTHTAKTKVETTSKSIKKISKDADKLAAEINTYCQFSQD